MKMPFFIAIVVPMSHPLPWNDPYITKILVHRHGTGGSMHACHAAGLGSNPSWDKFPG